jgi:hypothetical protein
MILLKAENFVTLDDYFLLKPLTLDSLFKSSHPTAG